MRSYGRSDVLLLQSVMLINVLTTGSRTDEQRLFDKLLQGNRSDILARPVAHVTHAVHVNITAHLLQILEVDAKQQALSISAYLEVLWVDQKLSWSEAEYGGLTHVVMEAEDLWTPDIGLVNSLDADFDFSKEKKFKVIVSSDGVVTWVPGGNYKAGCPLDLSYFPFDEQKCHWIFASWTYSSDALKIISPVDIMKISDVVTKSEWMVKGIKAFSGSILFDKDNAKSEYSVLHIVMTSVRDPGYYVFTIVVPAVVTSFLVLTVFLLPCESGEKVSLGITILLAFTVFQLVVADKLPANTRETPLLVVYLTLLMMTTAVSTVLSVFVLNLHHMNGDTRLNNSARTFLYDGLAKMTFYKARHRLPPSCHVRSADDREVAMRSKESENDVKASREEHDRKLKNPSKISGEERDEVIFEWKEAANIVDRCILVLYFVTVTVITITYLVVIPSSEKTDDTTIGNVNYTS